MTTWDSEVHDHTGPLPYGTVRSMTVRDCGFLTTNGTVRSSGNGSNRLYNMAKNTNLHLSACALPPPENQKKITNTVRF